MLVSRGLFGAKALAGLAAVAIIGTVALPLLSEPSNFRPATVVTALTGLTVIAYTYLTYVGLRHEQQRETRQRNRKRDALQEALLTEIRLLQIALEEDLRDTLPTPTTPHPDAPILELAVQNITVLPAARAAHVSDAYHRVNQIDRLLDLLATPDGGQHRSIIADKIHDQVDSLGATLLRLERNLQAAVSGDTPHQNRKEEKPADVVVNVERMLEDEAEQ